jgi:redox-sensitive bicupin YhaK (pirin superfamily)
MSAGTGISHSEYNTSQSEPVHFLQIWIMPGETGLAPGYEQQAFSLDKKRGRWVLVASKEGRVGSLTLHQDVDVWAARFGPEDQAIFRLKPNRHAWLQMARGDVSLNGTTLKAGDGAAISIEEKVQIQALDHTEILLFDVA